MTALGLADREAGRAVGRDTAFRIASMTKNMTALAILSLRDAGKVVLDAPLPEYVPQFAAVKPADRRQQAVTVRDLLCHVAGFVTDDPWGDRVLGMTPAELDDADRHGHAVCPRAGARLRIFQPGLCAARPGADQRERRALPGLHAPALPRAARHGAHHLRRARGGARRLCLRLPSRRRGLVARAHRAGRRGRRDGRAGHDRAGLCTVGRLPALGLAGARRSGGRAGAAGERARDGALSRAALPARLPVPLPSAYGYGLVQRDRRAARPPACIIPAACRATARTC